MPNKKHIIAVILLAFAILSGIVIGRSTDQNNLERNLIESAETKITSVYQYAFGKGGLALIGQDEEGAGAFILYAKLPGIRRYIQTESFGFAGADQPIYQSAASWSGNQVLVYQDGEMKVEGSPKGWGFAGTFAAWVSVSVLASLFAVICTIKIRKRFTAPSSAASNKSIR